MFGYWRSITGNGVRVTLVNLREMYTTLLQDGILLYLKNDKIYRNDIYVGVIFYG